MKSIEDEPVKIERKKVMYVKGMKILFTGIMVAVVVVFVPFAARTVYAFDADNRIEALIPAESISAVVEAGAGEGVGMVTEPFVLGNDTSHIEALIPAETTSAQQ